MNSEMKVAMVRPPHSGNSTRGVGFYASRLFFALEKMENVRIEWVNFSFNPLAYQNFDIVHYPYFDFTFPTFLPIPGKTVVTIHDVIPLKFPEVTPFGLRGKAVWPVQKKLTKLASEVITVSQTSKTDIEDCIGIPDTKIHVVYESADPEFFPASKKEIEAVKKKYHLPEKFVLYVGGVNKNKNLPILAKACVDSDLPLVLIGKSMLGEGIVSGHVESQPFEELMKIIKNSSSVVRIGFTQTEELRAIYSCATVYVQPSIYEGFGLPVVEAMSCGCPVICGENSSLGEIGKGAAIFADITSPQTLSEKITEVFNFSKNERERVVKKSLKRAKDFSWDKAARETVEVYEIVHSK